LIGAPGGGLGASTAGTHDTATWLGHQRSHDRGDALYEYGYARAYETMLKEQQLGIYRSCVHYDANRSGELFMWRKGYVRRLRTVRLNQEAESPFARSNDVGSLYFETDPFCQRHRLLRGAEVDPAACGQFA
jgi:hypothetical protein